jgi:hypothetical protein
VALHPNFPQSPYETLHPDVRWFPAAEEMRSTTLTDAAAESTPQGFSARSIRKNPRHFWITPVEPVGTLTKVTRRTLPDYLRTRDATADRSWALRRRAEVVR